MSTAASTATPPARKSTVSPAWQNLPRALAWLTAGMVLGFLGMVALAITFLLSYLFRGMDGSAPGANSTAVLLALTLASSIAVLLGGLLLLVGQCQCCLVPEESGARPLATGALACSILSSSLVAYAVVPSVPLQSSSSGHQPPMTAPRLRGGFPEARPPAPSPDAEKFVQERSGLLAASNVLAFAGSILLVSFLCGVGQSFENKRLVRGANYYLAYLTVCPALGVLLAFVVAQNLTNLQDQVGQLVFLLFFLVGLLIFLGISFFWFISLLEQTKRTIARALEGTDY